MNTKKKKSEKATIVSRILLIVYVLMTLYPILFVLLTSFKKTSEFYRNIWGLPEVFAIENYAEAWKTAQIGSYMKNSVLIIVIVLAATLLTGALAGYALSRFHIRHAELIMMLILFCTMVPSESVIMPMYLIISKMKLTAS